MTPIAYLQSKLGDLPIQNIIKIGRHPNNNLVLSNMSVSSIHAEIFFKKNKIFLKDHSTNGTWVNNIKIHHNICPLAFGSRLRFGGDQIEFTIVEKPSHRVSKKEIEPRSVELHQWANLISGHTVQDMWAVFNGHNAMYQTRWKIHVYIDDITDLYNISKAIIPTLKNKGILFKTTIIPEKAISMHGGQHGKAFTIYVCANPLNNIKLARSNALKIRNVLIKLLSKFPKHGMHKITGDLSVPGDTTGRLFYRYDGNIPLHEITEFRNEHYRANLPPYMYNIEFNEDIFTGATLGGKRFCKRCGYKFF